MSGYITFWSKEYVKKLEKAGDRGKFCVVYGSQHQKMPSIASLKKGDIIYTVSIKDKTLAVMARMPVEKIEPAFDYLMRETGEPHSSLVPEGIVLRSQGSFGEFLQFSESSGYADRIQLPENIDKIIDIEKLTPIDCKLHQIPITCCADLAASSTHGSEIFPRIIPIETVKTMTFGKTVSSQKPLKLDKNGNLTSISLSGFVRKMSSDTFHIFESLF